MLSIKIEHQKKITKSVMIAKNRAKTLDNMLTSPVVLPSMLPLISQKV